MKSIYMGGTLLAMVLTLAFFTPPPAFADSYHEMTLVTFKQPVQIPGNRVLPAGRYWFRLLSPQDARGVVVIYSAKHRHVEALLLTSPAYRENPTSRTKLTLAQQGQTLPDALLQWFYPGRQYGHEFVYSKQEQRRLSEDTKLTVLPPAHYGG